MFVDAHAHLDKYPEEDLGRVLDAIDRRRILTFSVSVDTASFEQTEAIAARSPLVVPGFGIHPSEAPRYADSLPELDELVCRSPFIGEVGLDHRFVTDETLHGAQREVFGYFLKRAHDQAKLVNVHCAGAENDTADMLIGGGIERGVIHWYSGPLDTLARLTAAGFFCTVGVEVLRSDDAREVARRIPEEQLLTETDNPGGLAWLTGESGQPSKILDVVDELARVRRMTPDGITALVLGNVRRLIENDEHLEPWLNDLDP